jgi:diazepam-binding inhibitor (GABA receptor modulator, acyl-CoA-binding protein)
MSENDQLLHDLFMEHVEKIKLFHTNHKISNDDLLKLYGLYKQSVDGDACDNNNFRNLKEKKMYESWAEYKGLNSDYTKQYFINTANQLIKLKNKS